MERAELAHALRRWMPKTRDHHARDRRYINDPAASSFMARFAQAVAGTGEVFLGNPTWGENERKQVQDIFSAGRTAAARQAQTLPSELGWLMIPTGGTSGGVKFARHDARSMGTAVHGFVHHFGLGKVNAVGVLPLFHVSGLMGWLRCAATGGDFINGDWRALAAGNFPRLPERDDGWVLSLVPTQLERLMNDTAALAWLRQFRIIFVGGGPSWSGLLERAAGAGLPLSPGYGMTETAAMVAALRPDEFLAGSRSYGTALPHVRIDFDLEGVISVTSESVFRGYYPQRDDDRTFSTEDIGEFDASGRLRVFGRRDGVIITGGEKVHPSEVESVLRGTGQFNDLLVLGAEHPKWGQQVVVAYPADGKEPDIERVLEQLGRELAPYKRPKRFIPISHWPVAANGKLRRGVIAQRVHAVMQGPRQ